MHVHGESKILLKGNPNLTCEEQKKKTLNRSILHKQNKEIEAEKVELGF